MKLLQFHSCCYQLLLDAEAREHVESSGVSVDQWRVVVGTADLDQHFVTYFNDKHICANF